MQAAIIVQSKQVALYFTQRRFQLLKFREFRDGIEFSRSKPEQMALHPLIFLYLVSHGFVLSSLCRQMLTTEPMDKQAVQGVFGSILVHLEEILKSLKQDDGNPLPVRGHPAMTMYVSKLIEFEKPEIVGTDFFCKAYSLLAEVRPTPRLVPLSSQHKPLPLQLQDAVSVLQPSADLLSLYLRNPAVNVKQLYSKLATQAKTHARKLEVNCRFMGHLLASKDFKLVAIILKKNLQLLGQAESQEPQQTKILALIGRTKELLRNFEFVNALFASS